MFYLLSSLRVYDDTATIAAIARTWTIVTGIYAQARNEKGKTIQDSVDQPQATIFASLPGPCILGEWAVLGYGRKDWPGGECNCGCDHIHKQQRCYGPRCDARFCEMPADLACVLDPTDFCYVDIVILPVSSVGHIAVCR